MRLTRSDDDDRSDDHTSERVVKSEGVSGSGGPNKRDAANSVLEWVWQAGKQRGASKSKKRANARRVWLLLTFF